MRVGKKILALLLMLALLASMSAFALAEDGDAEIVVEETVIEAETEEAPEGEPEKGESKLTVKCVDTDGKTIRDKEEDYLDLSKDLVVDDKYSHPEIENYTYQKMTVNGEEIKKLTVTHEGETPVITVTIGEGEEAKEKTLTGSETLLFVYEAKAHEHSWGTGVVTKEPTCTEKGVRTFTCSCGETKTEDIDPLGHDWNEPTYTWSGDNSSCTATRVCKRDASHTESETVKPVETVTKEPTCTEKGQKTLTASFENSAFAQQNLNVEIPALGHDFAHGRCKRCDAIDPNFKPKLTDNTGGHASWGTDYKVTSDAAPKDFQKVLVDGKELSSSDYKVTEKDGNTVVTIYGSAIKNLTVGQHKISVVSATGTAEKWVTVSDKPKTGDENMGLWVGLLSLSALGCGAIFITLRKKTGAR